MATPSKKKYSRSKTTIKKRSSHPIEDLFEKAKEKVKDVFEPRDSEMLVSTEKLLDFLSEFLAVEKGGIQLYRKAIQHASEPEIKKKYTEYLAQTERHEELLTGAIKRMGGSPTYVSPGAAVQMQRAKSMLELKVPAELREIADAENLLLAETKDHADWSFLKDICSRIATDDARQAIREIVGEVEAQEDEHLKFAQKTVDQLAHLLANSTSHTKTKAA